MNNVLLKNLDSFTEGSRFHFRHFSIGADSMIPTSNFQTKFIRKRKHISDYVGSCNGILHFDNRDGDGVLWNPTTKKVYELPRPDDSVLRAPAVGFTETKNSGFGYDVASNDYKVIRFLNQVYEESYEEPDDPGEEVRDLIGIKSQVVLYSLKTDSWEDLPFPVESTGCCFRHQRIYVNGCFYWIGARMHSSDYQIVVFNFATKKFSFIPLSIISPHLDTKLVRYRLRFVDFHGSLGVVIFDQTSHFVLWAQTGSGTWNQQFDFSLDFEVVELLGYFSPGYLRDFSRGYLFMLGKNNQLLLYDWVEKEVKKLDVYGHNGLIEVICYIATTASPYPTQYSSDYELLPASSTQY